MIINYDITKTRTTERSQERHRVLNSSRNR